MRIPVTAAKVRRAALVRRAEAGDEIVLTRRGQAVARLTAVQLAMDRHARRALLDDLRQTARRKATPGPDATRSADDLYDGDGLPG